MKAGGAEREVGVVTTAVRLWPLGGFPGAAPWALCSRLAFRNQAFVHIAAEHSWAGWWAVLCVWSVESWRGPRMRLGVGGVFPPTGFGSRWALLVVLRDRQRQPCPRDT